MRVSRRQPAQEPALPTYLPVDEFVERLHLIGLREVKPRTLKTKALAESNAIDAGELSADEAQYLLYSGRWYVHIQRYCRANNIDPAGLLNDSELGREGNTEG